jgi:hypothetical protein
MKGLLCHVLRNFPGTRVLDGIKRKSCPWLPENLAKIIFRETDRAAYTVVSLCLSKSVHSQMDIQ